MKALIYLTPEDRNLPVIELQALDRTWLELTVDRLSDLGIRDVLFISDSSPLKNLSKEDFKERFGMNCQLLDIGDIDCLMPEMEIVGPEVMVVHSDWIELSKVTHEDYKVAHEDSFYQVWQSTRMIDALRVVQAWSQAVKPFEPEGFEFLDKSSWNTYIESQTSSLESYLETNGCFGKASRTDLRIGAGTTVLTEPDKLKNVLISQDCFVSRDVILENVILGPNVMVDSGTVLRNCIVLADSYVGANLRFDNCCLDGDTIHSQKLNRSIVMTDPMMLRDISANNAPGVLESSINVIKGFFSQGFIGKQAD